MRELPIRECRIWCDRAFVVFCTSMSLGNEEDAGCINLMNETAPKLSTERISAFFFPQPKIACISHAHRQVYTAHNGD